MDASLIAQAWGVLNALTPLKTDCGLICGAACCFVDEDGQGGVLLFPHERELMNGARWGALNETPDGWLLMCDGMCDRAQRPLGCRIFPLTPKKRRDGSYGVRIDRRAFAVCPLAGSGTTGLDPAFVSAAERAIGLIAGNKEGRAFLNDWIKRERAYAQPLF